MNIYDLIDNEMKRMEKERDFLFQKVLEINKPHTHADVFLNHYLVAYKDLSAYVAKKRELIFSQFENRDEKIQQKIAELALTGDSNE